MRQKTVAFFDVQFSTLTVKQGESLTITGTAKILETWPTTLPEPKVAYFSVVAGGPQFVMKERTVNGRPAPGSVFIKKGGVYEFRMQLEGRTPGRWHVHPVIAVEGAGTLLGPGEWVTVQDAGGYQNRITLLNGKTIDLENYHTPFIAGWSVIGLILGLWWMWYWTGPKRTVTRLAVTSQLPLNDDGAAVGLVTPQDHRFVNLLALLSVAVLGIGWLYARQAFPVRIPQQVVRFEPPALPEPPAFAEAKASGATYDPDTDTLRIEVEVTNRGTEPLQVVDFTTSNLTFVNQALAGPRTAHFLTLDPEGKVAPGETRKFQLSIQDPVWEAENLIPKQQSQLSVAGLLTVEDASGRRNRLTIESALLPTRFDW